MEVKFDKRIELLFGLGYCVHSEYNNGPKDFYKETMTSYCNEFYELYKNYSCEALIDYIKNGGIDTYNRTLDIALSLNENYDLIETNDIKEIEKNNKFFNRKTLEQLIKDFVKKSNYDIFYEQYKSTFDFAINKYKESLNKYVIYDEKILSEFYGECKKQKVILFNFVGGSFGKEIGDILINVQCIMNNIDNEIEFSPRIVNTCFHEFSHPYLNPLGYKYFKTIKLDNLFQNAKNNGLQECYTCGNDIIIIINEYMVRSVQVYLCGKYMEEDYVLRQLNYHKKLGYIFIEDTIKLLDKRNNYNNFEEFYRNEIVTYFTNINNNLQND